MCREHIGSDAYQEHGRCRYEVIVGRRRQVRGGDLARWSAPLLVHSILGSLVWLARQRGVGTLHHAILLALRRPRG